MDAQVLQREIFRIACPRKRAVYYIQRSSESIQDQIPISSFDFECLGLRWQENAPLFFKFDKNI